MFLSSLCLCVQIYCSLCKYTCRLLSVCIRRAAYTHVCVRQWASQVRSCFCQKLSALPLVRRLLCHWCTRPFWLNRFGSAVRAVINGKKRTVPCECVRLLVCNDLPWTRSAEPDRCHDALIHRRETLKNHYCISKRECWDRWRMFDLFFFFPVKWGEMGRGSVVKSSPLELFKSYIPRSWWMKYSSSNSLNVISVLYFLIFGVLWP